MMRPQRRSLHALVDRVRAEEGGLEVGGDGVVEVFFGQLVELRREGVAGVVDQDVDRAELFFDRGDEGCDFFRLRDVGLEGGGVFCRVP